MLTYNGETTEIEMRGKTKTWGERIDKITGTGLN